MALRLRFPLPATFVHQLASLVSLAASSSPSPPSTAGSSLASPAAPSHLASPSFFAALELYSQHLAPRQHHLPPHLHLHRRRLHRLGQRPCSHCDCSVSQRLLACWLRLHRRRRPTRPPASRHQLLYTSHSHRRAWWGPSRRLHRCRPCRDLRLLRRRSCRRPLCRRSTRQPRRRLQRCRPLRRWLRCRLSRRRSTRWLLRCRSC